MLRHESGDMDLAEDREKRMLRHGSGDMDLAEDPEIYMDAKTCVGHMDRETWILQRILRYEDVRHESGDMDLAENP